jgi:hypothetical protein
MNKEEILESNVLIATFMGYEKLDKNSGLLNPEKCLKFKTSYVSINQLKYHKDWNWLMKVLERICRLKIGDGKEYVEYAYPRTFGMLNEETGQIMVRLNGSFLHEADTLIEATYQSVVEFIKWYNSTNNTNSSSL